MRMHKYLHKIGSSGTASVAQDPIQQKQWSQQQGLNDKSDGFQPTHCMTYEIVNQLNFMLLSTVVILSNKTLTWNWKLKAHQSVRNKPSPKASQASHEL